MFPCLFEVFPICNSPLIFVHFSTYPPRIHLASTLHNCKYPLVIVFAFHAWFEFLGMFMLDKHSQFSTATSSYFVFKILIWFYLLTQTIVVISFEKFTFDDNDVALYVSIKYHLDSYSFYTYFKTFPIEVSEHFLEVLCSVEIKVMSSANLRWHSPFMFIYFSNWAFWKYPQGIM